MQATVLILLSPNKNKKICTKKFRASIFFFNDNDPFFFSLHNEPSLLTSFSFFFFLVWAEKHISRFPIFLHNLDKWHETQFSWLTSTELQVAARDWLLVSVGIVSGYIGRRVRVLVCFECVCVWPRKWKSVSNRVFGCARACMGVRMGEDMWFWVCESVHFWMGVFCVQVTVHVLCCVGLFFDACAYVYVCKYQYNKNIHLFTHSFAITWTHQQSYLTSAMWITI